MQSNKIYLTFTIITNRYLRKNIKYQIATIWYGTILKNKKLTETIAMQWSLNK